MMTEEFDAVVFDVGGTLLDMRPTRAEIFAKVLDENDHKLDPNVLARAIAWADRLLDDRYAPLERGNDDQLRKELVRTVLDLLGMRGGQDHLDRALLEELERVIPQVESWVDFPETKEVLRALRKRGFTLGVVSNATDLVTKVLDNLRLSEDFDFIIVSEEVGVNKPSTRIFQLAAERAHTSPNRMLYIGDRLSTDIRGAVGAGMNAVLIDRADVYPDADCIRLRDLRFLETFL